MTAPLLDRLKGYRVREQAPIPPVAGKLTRVVGLTLEAIGCRAAIGSLCRIDTQDGALEAEVVGFAGDRLFLMPSEQLKGVIPGARVVPVTEDHGIPVGMSLLGRVIDGIGQPLDGLGPILSSQTVQFAQHRINPLARRPIHQPMDVGVRAINAVLTVGQGQRMGLFAGSGVGKSVLLSMLAMHQTITKLVKPDVHCLKFVYPGHHEISDFWVRVIHVRNARLRSVELVLQPVSIVRYGHAVLNLLHLPNSDLLVVSTLLLHG